MIIGLTVDELNKMYEGLINGKDAEWEMKDGKILRFTLITDKQKKVNNGRKMDNKKLIEEANKRRVQIEIIEGIESLLNALDFIDDEEPTWFTDEVQILIAKFREKR